MPITQPGGATDLSGLLNLSPTLATFYTTAVVGGGTATISGNVGTCEATVTNLDSGALISQRTYSRGSIKTISFSKTNGLQANKFGWFGWASANTYPLAGNSDRVVYVGLGSGTNELYTELNATSSLRTEFTASPAITTTSRITLVYDVVCYLYQNETQMVSSSTGIPTAALAFRIGVVLSGGAASAGALNTAAAITRINMDR